MQDRELIELIVAATASLNPEEQDEVRRRIGCVAPLQLIQPPYFTIPNNTDPYMYQTGTVSF